MQCQLTRKRTFSWLMSSRHFFSSKNFTFLKNSHFNRFEERQELLLRTIAVLLAKWTNETTLCEWIQFFLGRVQFNFSNGTTKSSIELSLFYLDLLMYSMSVAAGCTIFVPTVPSANESMAWINKFPETLWLLSKRTDGWSDAMPRVSLSFRWHSQCFY